MIIVGMEVEGINLSTLTEVRVPRFQIKLFACIFLTVLFAWLALTTPSVVWLLPAVLLGIMYAHAVELQHQCLHNTAYRSKRWNRFVGVLLGLPSLVSFSDYQSSHMNHHRLLGTPEDKEFFNYGYESLTTMRKFVPHLFMVRHYQDVARYIFQSATGKLTREGASPKVVKKIRDEYLLMAAFLIAMVGLSIGFHTIIFLKLWLIPLLAAIPAHALIELPEHFGCDGRTTDILRNTRTIKAGWLGNWYTHGNNYHVEHHWLPSVPNDKFAELHRHTEPGILYLESSYWSFYSQFIGHLLRADKQQGPWVTERKPKVEQPGRAFKAAAAGAHGGQTVTRDNQGTATVETEPKPGDLN